MNLKNILKFLKFQESTISMIIGAIIIVIIGVILVNYFSGRGGETIPSVGIEDETKLPTSHTIKEGEDLWKISEKYYGTGYNWVDIAQENQLANPNEITEGQVLTIPDKPPRVAEDIGKPSVIPSPISTPIPTEKKEIVSSDEKKHTVLKGETLWSISEKYFENGFEWKNIAQANNIDAPENIEEGTELVIPTSSAKVSMEIKEMEAISGATYTVQKGDNLWNISVRAYGDGYKWTQIARENNLINPGLIHIGNTLSLPR